ncbi:hypothetical protein B0H11DRAFT_1915035 [Mycena galericulata]|nr:hypothetical protein B0H11DRAFT_1915035 [Mycena galericulata]
MGTSPTHSGSSSSEVVLSSSVTTAPSAEEQRTVTRCQLSAQQSFLSLQQEEKGLRREAHRAWRISGCGPRASPQEALNYRAVALRARPYASHLGFVRNLETLFVRNLRILDQALLYALLFLDPFLNPTYLPTYLPVRRLLDSGKGTAVGEGTPLLVALPSQNFLQKFRSTESLGGVEPADASDVRWVCTSSSIQLEGKARLGRGAQFLAALGRSGCLIRSTGILIWVPIVGRRLRAMPFGCRSGAGERS